MNIEVGVARQQFPALLAEKGYRIGAEIGVQGGDHAVHLLTNWSGSLYLVDAWKHYAAERYADMGNVSDEAHEIHYRRCMDQIAEFGPRAVVKRMFSHEAVNDFEDESLDFVFLDANHTYPYVLRDQEIWYPKIRPHGMMSGHDFTVDAPPREGNVFGVKPAVLDFMEGKADVLYVAKEEWPTWYFFKPAVRAGVP